MMGMKTEDLPNGTGRVFEGAPSEAEPAAAKARVAHTPPIDIIGGRWLTLYSDGTPGVLERNLQNSVFSQVGTWTGFACSTKQGNSILAARCFCAKRLFLQVPLEGAPLGG
jgi:hypothetical protein